MRIIKRTIGVIIVSAALVVTSGCNTPGGTTSLLVAIGLVTAITASTIMSQISKKQQDKLNEQSPQTLKTIQQNDRVYQQQKQAPKPPTPADASQAQTPPPPAEALIPLTVEDIKALDSAGVKKDVIIDEIKRSQSVFTQADITALQQSNPNIDPAIIKCMKNPS